MPTVASYTQDKPFWDQHGRVGLVWSNPKASDDVLIIAALLRPNFHLLLDIAVHFGLDRLKNQWRDLADGVEERQSPEEIRKVARATAIVERCLTTMLNLKSPTEVMPPATAKIFAEIRENPLLSPFILIGGTALSRPLSLSPTSRLRHSLNNLFSLHG